MMSDLRSAAVALSHPLSCLNGWRNHRHCHYHSHPPHRYRPANWHWPSPASPPYRTSSAPQPCIPRTAAHRCRSGSASARRREVCRTIVCQARGARGGSERSGRWRREACPRRQSGRRCWDRRDCLFFWICCSGRCCGGDIDS